MNKGSDCFIIIENNRYTCLISTSRWQFCCTNLFLKFSKASLVVVSPGSTRRSMLTPMMLAPWLARLSRRGHSVRSLQEVRGKSRWSQYVTSFRLLKEHSLIGLNNCLLAEWEPVHLRQRRQTDTHLLYILITWWRCSPWCWSQPRWRCDNTLYALCVWEDSSSVCLRIKYLANFFFKYM